MSEDQLCFSEITGNDCKWGIHVIHLRKRHHHLHEHGVAHTLPLISSHFPRETKPLVVEVAAYIYFCHTSNHSNIDAYVCVPPLLQCSFHSYFLSPVKVVSSFLDMQIHPVMLYPFMEA